MNTRDSRCCGIVPNVKALETGRFTPMINPDRIATRLSEFGQISVIITSGGITDDANKDMINIR
jgi:hypothetical protein